MGGLDWMPGGARNDVPGGAIALANRPPVVGFANALLIGGGGGCFGDEEVAGGEDRSTSTSEVCGGDDILKVCVGCVMKVRGGEEGRALIDWSFVRRSE